MTNDNPTQFAAAPTNANTPLPNERLGVGIEAWQSFHRQLSTALMD